MSKIRLALASGVAAPIAYFGTLLGASLRYPGYDHFRQYASELGMAGEPSAALFNSGILVAGVLLLLAPIGLYAGATTAGARRRWSALAALGVGLFGVGLVMGALFPMPNPLHGGFGLGLAINLAPPSLAIAIWRLEDLRGLRHLLLATTVAMTIFLSLLFGVGGVITLANVGLFQRLYALSTLPWIAVACYALLRRQDPASG